MEGTVGKRTTFCPNRNQISRAKEETGLEQNKQQMPGLNIARKKKLKLILADLAYKNEVQTDGQSLPFSLPLMTQRKPSYFAVRSFFKTWRPL
jgi:hypothetical protein